MDARLPEGFILKPPVSLRDLVQDSDHDPKEAETLVAIVRQLRQEGAEIAAE